jgi:anhydro-N-acetylmuramic acid kinase
MRVIGLMSGTSFDAIDAVAADIGVADDAVVIRLLGMISAPYPDDVVADLVAALPPAPVTMAAVCSLDTRIGQAFAAVAARAVDELAAGAADLIVSHGQTVFHWVEGDAVRGTLQLGQPAWIAERTGLPVVSDLRSRDVAAHGQGAPLVSLLDVWWLRSRPGSPVALNLGGIANLTVGIGTDRPTAFDVGPANALIDAAIWEFSGGRQSFDADGAAANRGQVSPALLADLLAESYYRRPAPKTTGKELFGLDYLRRALAPYPGLHTDDVLATLTELTARTVADAVLAAGATEVIASGGGTRNPTLMARLARALPGVALRTSDQLGLPSGAKEGLAFALLGFLTVHGWPGTVASCTGADHPSILGSITPGRVPLAPAGSEPPPARLRLE